MKIALISFTLNGQILGKEIREKLRIDHYEVQLFTKCRYQKSKMAIYVEESIEMWTGKMFQQTEGIVFVGACGIAVRSIAPFLKDKKNDPAVIVVDDTGKFCISLLSGHIGGANELTNILARRISAIPVITTATDLNQKFAVDVFAKKNNLEMSDSCLAKEISAVLLAGKKVNIFSESNLPENLPEGLVFVKENTSFINLYIGIYRNRGNFNDATLFLTPKVITLGIGCKKETKSETIEQFVEQVCKENYIDKKAIRQVVSIDLKIREPGILEYCNKFNLSFRCFTNEELNRVKGEFSSSLFVEAITGVDNVCERSAVLGSNQGKLILKKKAHYGVTLAMAVEEWSVDFE
ncbi:cobalt-precorrin 5A hydrolase [Anaerosacchariphilus polymeriproducens]|uniref:Cobalamin biosynthesis protein CbiG n=1 Tax=Anaerosacchariphilus polymeriproducens TaxID=1812858 RepID=A0A371AY71_9FIRM|nr:cobalt-precorrin 5A hydrolase [Anaerosacchariphilus polymeriproducens]RDU24535.1 cobalamin biosynthesis protein CbiG [Anaerosacchariphilus polymeriproducens]